MNDGFREWWHAAGAQRRWEWARDAETELAALREPESVVSPDPIEDVQQQSDEDFVEWYERTTKPAPLWAEQAREWAHSLGGEDGSDLAELIGVHFFDELPRARPASLDDRVEKLEWRFVGSYWVADAPLGLRHDQAWYIEPFRTDDEVMLQPPTTVICASTDAAKALAERLQAVLSSPTSVGGGE